MTPSERRDWWERPSAAMPADSNPAAKLTWAEVREIRPLYAAGDFTLSQLSDRFDVSTNTIAKVVRRDSWQDDPEDGQP